MKTILSFTTIPPRFQYVTDYIENLKKIENFDEIWVNIPKTIGFRIGMGFFHTKILDLKL